MSIRTILTGEDEPVLHKACHPVIRSWPICWTI